MHIVVRNRRVCRHAIIPQRDRALLPAHAHLEVLAERDMVEQQLQQRLGLLVAQPDDALGEARVNKQRLLPCRRVHAHDRVQRLDGLAPDVLPVVPGAFGLREAAVLGAEALEEGLDGRREARVGGRLRGPAGVAAGGGHGEEGQDGDSWGLVLVGDVGVVACGGEAGAAPLVAVLVVGAEVDVVQLDVVLDVGPDRLGGCQQCLQS